MKSTSETVKVPYSVSKGKSQTVEVFIRDKDNSGNSASQTFKITKDKTISIPLKIEKVKLRDTLYVLIIKLLPIKMLATMTNNKI